VASGSWNTDECSDPALKKLQSEDEGRDDVLPFSLSQLEEKKNGFMWRKVSPFGNLPHLPSPKNTSKKMLANCC
jgi:hypothetical protein